MSKLHPSQLFSIYIILFLIGILLSPSLPYDPNIYLQTAVLLISVALVFYGEHLVRGAGISLAIMVFGLAYPHLFAGGLVDLADSWLVIKLQNLRQNFQSVLSNILPLPYSDLAAGLVVGISQSFPADLKNAFINSGTIHIVAISGYNVAIVIKIFSDFLKQFGRQYSFWVGTASIVAFTILVGGQASVVRAAIMGWLFLLARYVYRLPYVFTALIFSALVMTLQNYRILTEVSFLLSFGAMAGMIYVSPVFRGLIDRYLKHLPIIVRSVLAETLGAQIVVTPILIHYFGRLSLVSPLANILILPLVPLTMLLSFGGYLINFIHFSLAKIIGLPLFLLLKYIIFIAEKTAVWPYSNLQVEKWSWLIIFIYYFALFFIIKKIQNQLKNRYAKSF